MGDFEEVERLQAGIRTWLLRSARSGRHELRDGGAGLLPLLCAAAFGPALADRPDGSAGATMGVLVSVGADVLAPLLEEAAGHARSAHMPGDDQSRGAQQDLNRSLEREISRSVGEVLAAHDKRAGELRSDIAMVLREIDAGGTVFRAAIEAGDEELQREVLAAFEALGAEFGDMAFLLADLARAAGEIQDSLGRQGAELRAASEQAGRQSADVRMIREELAVIERRAGQWLPEAADPGTRWSDGCPYRGLLSYEQAHGAVFYGRERLTAKLAGMLAGTGLVMVTGAAGGGKTSLLQAGLIPALARGVQVPGSSSWPVVSLTATARPLTDLAAALASAGGGDPVAIRQMLADAPGETHLLVREILLAAPGDAARLVLIIDQFEQVFAAGGPDAETERAAFVEAVCAAADRPAAARGEPPARVVIAVRGDHWDRCAAYPQLVPAMERGQLVVGPMAEAGLRRAITGPAEASGLRVDSALVDDIVSDVPAVAGPGGAVLPLLSQALALTWENREGDRLTRDGYDRAGRLARSVEVSAEAVYSALSREQQVIAREVLRRMTAAGPDRRPVRRLTPRAELRAGRQKNRPAEVDAVLGAFARSRLVVLHAKTAEIANDVVLQAWPRLRDWLEEDQASLILYGQLAGDTARWHQNRKDSALLYRGVQLAAAQEAARVWAADPGRYPALTMAEADFLRASGRASTRGRWGRRTLAGALVLLLAAVLAGAGLAVRSARNSAGQQRTADVSGQLAAQSTALEAADPVTASLLAGAAWRIAPTAEARYSLLESLAQPVRGILAAQSGQVTAVAYGPGGRTLAAGYQDGTIRLWDVISHRLISAATWSGAALALAFADGGKTLEVADPAAVGVWDLNSQARITAQPLTGTATGLAAGGLAGTGPGGGVAAAFSPDGAIVATGGDDGNVRLWDVATRQEIGAPMSSGLTPVETVAFSPDGATVAAGSSDGTVQLWDVATQQEAGTTMATGSAAVGALAFRPGGKFLATGGDDGNVRLWDVATQSQAGTTMATGGPVTALAFDASGTTLATAESGGTTELWGFATQRQTGAALPAQGAGLVSALAFSPAANALAAGDANGTIDLWDPAGFHQSSAPIATGTPESVAAAAGHAPGVLSDRDDVLAVSDGRGTVRLWNALTRQVIGRPVVSRHAVTGLALSADGRILAVVAGGLQLWSTATGQPIGGPLPAADASGPVAVSPDGALVAAIGTDGQARLWQVTGQREIGTAVMVGPGASQGALAFSPDGKTLAMAGADGTAALWSVTTQRRIGIPMIAGSTVGSAGPAGSAGSAAGQAAAVAAFSPDGATLAVADDGSVRLWHVATQQEIGTPMTAGTGPAYALAFSPDGTTLATADSDGSAREWDVATRQEIGTPMTAGTGPAYALAFGPDGTTLVTADSDGRARSWNVAFPAGLLAGACAIADQSLTRQQWAGYAGTQPFQQVCPAS